MYDKYPNKSIKDMSYEELLEYEKFLKNKGCDPGPKGVMGDKISFTKKIIKKIKSIIK